MRWLALDKNGSHEHCAKDRRAEMEEWLRIGANIASILTSVIAATASIVYWVHKRSRRTRLETYLKAKKARSPAEAFSATRLMADLGMTEVVFATATRLRSKTASNQLAF
jgi:hypothetical protein